MVPFNRGTDEWKNVEAMNYWMLRCYLEDTPFSCTFPLSKLGFNNMLFYTCNKYLMTMFYALASNCNRTRNKESIRNGKKMVKLTFLQPVFPSPMQHQSISVQVCKVNKNYVKITRPLICNVTRKTRSSILNMDKRQMEDHAKTNKSLKRGALQSQWHNP